MRRERNSNFEILRIVSILLIIAHHFSVHGGFDFGSTVSFNSIMMELFILGGKVGVNCFVLISGYFLVNSNQLNFRKLLLLWVKVFVYSTVLFAIFCGVGKLAFSWKELIHSALPVIFNQWWFVSVYVLLYIFHPFINVALRNISKQAHLVMLLIMLVLWSVIPTFAGRISGIQFSNFIWFVFLYCVAGYLRLHGLPKKLNAVSSLLLAVGSYAIVFGIAVVKNVVFGVANFYYEMESLTMLVPSVFLFLVFAYAKPRCIKFVNFVSSAMLGVYLLHDHELTMRTYIWRELFKNYSYTNSPYLVLYALFEIVSVFVVCIAVDLFYTYTLELLIKKAISSTWGEKICNKLTLQVSLPSDTTQNETENHKD